MTTNNPHHSQPDTTAQSSVPRQQQQQQHDTIMDDARTSFRRKSIEAAHDVSGKDWHIYHHSNNNNNNNSISRLDLSSSFVTKTTTTTTTNSLLRRRRPSSRRSLVTTGDTVKHSSSSSSSGGGGRFDRTKYDIGPSLERQLLEEQEEEDKKLPISTKDTKEASKQEESNYQRPSLLFQRHRHVHTLICLALFSYLGEFLRWFLEELFGLACHYPDTVGWNVREWAPCTTAPGTTGSTGGGMFTDLPANVLGCFLMGLLVTGDSESIAVNLPMAMLPRDAFFQQWTVTHVGLRTGFCGSLTTLASWNTQMVVMICGGSATVIGSSQWVSALFGYIVGLFVALQSFLLGRSIAVAMGRRFNPELALEADAIMDKKEMGIWVNRDLPDFERRFLHDVIVEEKDRNNPSRQRFTPQKSDDTQESGSDLQKYGKDVYQSHFDHHIHHLQAWKESTDEHRHLVSSYAQLLQSIEKAVVVDREEPRQELLETARDAGWNVSALRNWVAAMDKEEEREENNNHIPVDEATQVINEEEQVFWNGDYSNTETVLNMTFFLLLSVLFVWGAIYFDDTDPISVNYRNQFLSALLSPMGTLLRWYLSSFNGSIQHERWEWLPIGTLLANMIACVVSALTQGLLSTLDPDKSPLASSFSEAIKVGLAGSLSTVSTFVAETIGLLRALPRYFWGWYYSFGTLILGLTLGILSYFWAIL